MAKKINPDTRAYENILAIYSYFMANPQAISLNALAEKYSVSKATMLRYLASLESSGYGKLIVEQRGREHYYKLDRPQKLPKISLSVEGLQQLALCRDFISHLLPPDIQKHIEIALNQAVAYLPNDESPLQGLPHIASSFTRGKIDYTKHQEMLKTILTAIRKKLVCIITYKSGKRKNAEEKSFDYAPKKVLALGEAIHINGWKVTEKGRVEQLNEHHNNLLLHRIKNVELTIRSSENLQEVDEHDSGYFGFMQSEIFEATIRFYDYAATYIAERQWSSEQKIVENHEGLNLKFVDLTLKVQNKRELKSWVLSFGENAEIIAPDYLREELLNEAENLVVKYKKISQ